VSSKQPLFYIGLLFLITACSTTAPRAVENSDWQRQQNELQRLDSWELSGRVNVRYDNESQTPRIRWMQRFNEYHIRLWGTFNAGNTRITGRPGYVTMEQGNDVYDASSPEQLILDNLGYELPVSNLNYWIKGLPSPGTESQLSFNELNQLSSLVQDGWTVNYVDYRLYDSLHLPRRVELTRPKNDIRLRFIGLNWTLPGTTN